MGAWAANVAGLLGISGVAVAELCEGPALAEFDRCAGTDCQESKIQRQAVTETESDR